MQEKYGTRRLTILSINLDLNTTDEVSKFARRHDARYRVGLAADSLATELSVSMLPTTYLFAADGSLFKRYTGGPPEQVFVRDIDAALVKSK
ncbi:MAG: TlpA family protein disulfide reductase [Deltaproteobacteria bacterium]|nr:TlpA family protein disulfide reductase [Deltaproteobacteria bacterium]